MNIKELDIRYTAAFPDFPSQDLLFKFLRQGKVHVLNFFTFVAIDYRSAFQDQYKKVLPLKLLSKVD